MKNGIAWKLFGGVATVMTLLFALLAWQGTMRAKTQAAQARELETQLKVVNARLDSMGAEIASIRTNWTTWLRWWTNEAGSEGTGIPSMDATQNKQIEFLLGEMERVRARLERAP